MKKKEESVNGLFKDQLVEDKHSHKEPAPPKPAGPEPEAWAVVVESSQIYLNMVSLALKELGFGTHSFRHPSDAMVFLKGTTLEQLVKIAMVFADAGTADNSGLNFLDTLKAEESTNHLPFVFMANADDHANIKQAMSLGAHSCLTKPFRDGAISERVLEIQVSLQKAPQKSR